MLRFAATGTSHVGLVRPGNQDSAVITPHLVLVADGVGGGAAGEVASATTAVAVHEALLARTDDLPATALAAAVRHAQERVARAVDADPDREGMATTLTAIWLNDGAAALAHLGDSRAYVQRDSELIQITRDHTWTEHAVQKGALTEEAATGHPWRNVILRSVNGTPEQGDLLPLALRVGDRLLVASDGLTDLVAPHWIHQLVLEHDEDESLTHALVAAALAQGGRDNVTVVVATLVDSPAAQSGTRSEEPVLLGAAATPGHIAAEPDVRDAGSGPDGIHSMPDSGA